jgi:hypothetical protein
VRTRRIRTASVGKTRAWEALKVLLKDNTQQELADQAGVQQSVISALATLKTLPGRETLLKLEKIGIKGTWWAEKPLGRRAA